MLRGKSCSLFCMFLLVLSLFLFIDLEEANSVILFAETWESGNPPSCWPCKYMNSNCNFNSWYQPDYIDSSFWQLFQTPKSDRSSTRAHSGTYSYYQHRKAGEASTCDIYHTFAPPYPTTIYIRFYMYLTDDWTTAYVNRDNFLVHWIFTNSARSNTGFRLNLTANGQWGTCPPNKLCMLPEGDGGAQWWDTRATCSPSGNWTAGTDFLTLKNAWHCFEYKMQISGSKVILTEWIDGIQKRGPCTGPGQNESSFNKIIISGWDNLSTNISTGFYIDDIVVSDSYIGCSEPYLLPIP